ncbi:putative anti-restriction nuclease [Escherichia phage JLBYU50]|nr:putative anti-restriction nuclease [Escherichia phage JLBYU50]
MCATNQHDICYQPLTWIGEDHYAQRVIVCAANKYILNNGKELIIPCVRHANPVLSAQLNVLKDAGLIDKLFCLPDNQGFIDQYYNWWSRKDAYIIADNAKQINYERNGHNSELFSEGLY